jgi:hypothetical protein
MATHRFRTLVSLIALLAVLALPAEAQNRMQTNRSFVTSPKVLGMGDAGVALSSRNTSFFYNPAHIGRSASLIHINFAGVHGTISNSVVDQVEFFNNRLQPAIDTGIDNLSDAELRSLYEDTFAQGRAPSSVNGQFLLPSVIIGGKGVGVGAGVFATTGLDYRIENAGLGLPQLNVASMTDIMGVATVGIDLQKMMGFSGLAVGVTGKYTRRFLTVKNKPIDAFSSDENVYFIEGRSLGFDVGVLYDVGLIPIPGTLTLGATAYDIRASDFDYIFYGTPADLPVIGDQIDSDDFVVDPVQAEKEVQHANDRYALSPSYRIGVAYSPPSMGFLGSLSVAADYIGYKNPTVDQSFFAHLHMGAQMRLLRIFKVRGGLSQGYPTFGAGLGLGIIHFDYAFHGVEEGRIPGQIRNQRHSAQVRIGF